MSSSPAISSLLIVRSSRLSITVLSLSNAVGYLVFRSAAAATRPSSFSGLSIGATIESLSPCKLNKSLAVSSSATSTSLPDAITSPADVFLSLNSISLAVSLPALRASSSSTTRTPSTTVEIVLPVCSSKPTISSFFKSTFSAATCSALVVLAAISSAVASLALFIFILRSSSLARAFSPFAFSLAVCLASLNSFLTGRIAAEPPGTAASIISNIMPISPANFSPPTLSSKGTGTPTAFNALVKATPTLAVVSDTASIATARFLMSLPAALPIHSTIG